MIKLTIQETNQEPREVEVKEGQSLGLIANSYGMGTKLVKVEKPFNLSEYTTMRDQGYDTSTFSKLCGIDTDTTQCFEIGYQCNKRGLTVFSQLGKFL